MAAQCLQLLHGHPEVDRVRIPFLRLAGSLAGNLGYIELPEETLAIVESEAASASERQLRSVYAVFLKNNVRSVFQELCQ